VPLREYRCRCGKVFTELFDKEYPKTLKCICGGDAEYRVSGFGVKIDFRYGWDPGAGKYFDSARQRDTFLDESNLAKVPEGAFDTPYKGK
jgi:hypothetical protein